MVIRNIGKIKTLMFEPWNVMIIKNNNFLKHSLYFYLTVQVYEGAHTPKDITILCCFYWKSSRKT